MNKLHLNTIAEQREYNATDVYTLARERGVTAVEADDMHLQIDMDEPASLKAIAAYEILKDETDMVVDSLVTRSQNGHHHVYVRLKHPLDLRSRIALQSMFGSDPKRELLSLMRIDIRDPELVLFETEEELPRVLEFLGRAMPVKRGEAA